jgi:hypothetical protein
MSALTANRNTRELLCGAMNLHRRFPVKDGEVIYAGSIVAIDSNGEALPAADSSGLIAVGIANEYVDNTDDGEYVTCKSGVFCLNNSSGNACTNGANLNNLIYIEDDQTVGTSGGSNSIKAGAMRYVDSNGVWVEIGNIRTS